jgi:hypothetical protein
MRLKKKVRGGELVAWAVREFVTGSWTDSRTERRVHLSQLFSRSLDTRPSQGRVIIIFALRCFAMSCNDGLVMPWRATRATSHGDQSVKPTMTAMTEVGAKRKSRRINRARLASPVCLWRASKPLVKFQIHDPVRGKVSRSSCQRPWSLVNIGWLQKVDESRPMIHEHGLTRFWMVLSSSVRRLILRPCDR